MKTGLFFRAWLLVVGCGCLFGALAPQNAWAKVPDHDCQSELSAVVFEHYQPLRLADLKTSRRREVLSPGQRVLVWSEPNHPDQVHYQVEILNGQQAIAFGRMVYDSELGHAEKYIFETSRHHRGQGLHSRLIQALDEVTQRGTAEAMVQLDHTNLQVFRNAVHLGLSPLEAFSQTPIGKGFRRIKMHPIKVVPEHRQPMVILQRSGNH